VTSGLEILDKILCLLLSIDSLFVLLILLRHVCLDKLRDEVTVGAVAIGNCTEPVDLIGSLLKSFFSRKSSAICRDLGDKDGVLVNLGSACTANISSD